MSGQEGELLQRTSPASPCGSRPELPFLALFFLSLRKLWRPFFSFSFSSCSRGLGKENFRSEIIKNRPLCHHSTEIAAPWRGCALTLPWQPARSVYSSLSPAGKQRLPARQLCPAPPLPPSSGQVSPQSSSPSTPTEVLQGVMASPSVGIGGGGVAGDREPGSRCPKRW